MNFDLSNEQRMLKESVERLMAKTYDFESRRRYQEEPDGFGRENWARYAELGLLGLPFAEEDGGFGGGPVETMIVMEAFGRALALEPYLGGVVFCGALLRHGASASLRAELAPAIIEGALLLAFAHAEPQARYNLSDVATRARRDGDEYVLDGQKSLVLHGDSAGKFLVSARLSGEQRSRTGIALFLVDATAPGLTRRVYLTQDGTRAAELIFEGLRLSPDALVNEEASLAIDAAFDEVLASVCAEAVGAMDETLKMTVDYLKVRSQFGVALGSFQALQHRAADMYIALEQARSMAIYAAMSIAQYDQAARRDAVYAAKAQINESARFIGEQAVQLHGGIGMTMEYKLGHLFKRLTMISRLFADSDRCHEHLAQSGGLFTAD
jgi:pimeloyl-CoA dehydrogenase small subunit